MENTPEYTLNTSNAAATTPNRLMTIAGRQDGVHFCPSLSFQNAVTTAPFCFSGEWLRPSFSFIIEGEMTQADLAMFDIWQGDGKIYTEDTERHTPLPQTLISTAERFLGGAAVPSFQLTERLSAKKATATYSIHRNPTVEAGTPGRLFAGGIGTLRTKGRDPFVTALPLELADLLVGGTSGGAFDTLARVWLFVPLHFRYYCNVPIMTSASFYPYVLPVSHETLEIGDSGRTVELSHFGY